MAGVENRRKLFFIPQSRCHLSQWPSPRAEIPELRILSDYDLEGYGCKLI